MSDHVLEIDWYRISLMPTVIENVHESCYKSHAILNEVRMMLQRGDSRETILTVIFMLQSVPPVRYGSDGSIELITTPPGNK